MGKYFQELNSWAWKGSLRFVCRLYIEKTLGWDRVMSSVLV